MSKAKTPKKTTSTDAASITADTAGTGDFAFDKDALFVGIDLGTSRTSIATSTGVREVVPTYVGYPKDAIGHELLGTEPLFGELALKHRLSVDLVRPLAHGVIQEESKGGKNRNLTAAQELVRHLLGKAKAQPGQPVYGVIGAPARASIASKRILIDAARGILDAVMVVSEPFSVAYGLSILDRALVIDIGAGTTDLCRLHGTLPEEEDQITLDTAGDHVDQTMEKLIRKAYPKAQFTINMIRDLKERYGFVSDTADRVLVKFPVEGKPTEFDVTDMLREACQSIVGPMAEATAKLVATYDPEFQEDIRSRIILAGGGSQMTGLSKLIEAAMVEYGGAKVRRVEEPVYAGANGALKMAQRMPQHFWKVLS
ncbi:MAG: rod shape-determining protein [Candidatus Omnitrophica bacterium]|nr:rod shape-determining protein [Candidatus Omnitrophota bacterium]